MVLVDSPADILLFCQYLPHHRTAVSLHTVGQGSTFCSTSLTDYFADGYPEHDQGLYRTCDEEISLSPVAFLRASETARYRPDIFNHTAHVEQGPVQVRFSCHLLHQHLLITRRIKGAAGRSPRSAFSSRSPP